MFKRNKILVTGGAGYIGSHTCIELHKAGYDLIILDNLCNSSQETIKRLDKILDTSLKFYKGDIRDQATVRKIFQNNSISGVVHFAGLKAVGDSVSNPIDYYSNNVNGTFALLEIMKEFNCKTIVFSSSATVYGVPNLIPVKENSVLSPVNPYGMTKLVVENFLRDIFSSDQNWNIALLRYFNPVGAHISGLIGENPNDVPNNLMPYISQVAVGKLKKLHIFGGDYDTDDGTGVRDYVHVVDLAKGHVKALQVLNDNPQVLTVNLGTGNGYSVLDIVSAFEEASGKTIPYEIVERRAGDIDIYYADTSLAKEKLNWVAECDLYDMCKDSWRWQKKNPNGYEN